MSFQHNEAARKNLRERAAQAAALAIIARASGHKANADFYAKQAADLSEVANRA